MMAVLMLRSDALRKLRCFVDALEDAASMVELDPDYPQVRPLQSTVELATNQRTQARC